MLQQSTTLERTKGTKVSKKKSGSPMDEGAFEKERERMHRQLFSAVSHDLKTPLASMIGSIEIYARMKDKLSAEKKAILIETALQEAYRLDNFISNILDMAKLESGMVKPRLVTMDLGNALRECLIHLDNRLKGSRVTIKPFAGEITIYSDASLICRALSLILDNAVKYGGNPSIIDITYGMDHSSNECVIQVKDKGPGIPSGKEDSIFTKYTRFAKSDHQSAGTGLGLAICRALMHILGGDVKVSNDPQHGGAVFTLTLPQ